MKFYKFRELINLYLDKEITDDQLDLLKAEIRVSVEKKKLFSFYCRLHHASRLALVRMIAEHPYVKQINDANPQLFLEAKTIKVDFGSGEILGNSPSKEIRGINKKTNAYLYFGSIAASICLTFVIISGVFISEQREWKPIAPTVGFTQETKPENKVTVANLETGPENKVEVEYLEFVVLASNKDAIENEILNSVSDLPELALGFDEFEPKVQEKRHTFAQLRKRINEDLILPPLNEDFRYYPLYENEDFRPVLLGPAGSRENQFKSNLSNLRFQR